ncbi:MAG: response regulator [Thermodesulfobacteriota bacterium]|nr:response regulator [Thermodesulfobacteriota bacterium]
MDFFGKLRGEKTLLINDDEWIRDSMSRIFEIEDCPLWIVETAEEALERIKHQAYDIIISDNRLSGIQGTEFFRRIQDTYPNACKILMIAYTNKEILSETIRIGINNLIEKPFNIHSLERAISLFLSMDNRPSPNHIPG